MKENPLKELGIDTQDPAMEDERFAQLLLTHFPRALSLAVSRPGEGNESALGVVVANAMRAVKRSDHLENKKKVVAYLLRGLNRKARVAPSIQPVADQVRAEAGALVAGGAQKPAGEAQKPPAAKAPAGPAQFKLSSTVAGATSFGKSPRGGGRKTPPAQAPAAADASGIAFTPQTSPAPAKSEPAASPPPPRRLKPGAGTAGGMLLTELELTSEQLRELQRQVVSKVRRLPADPRSKSIFHSIQQMFAQLDEAELVGKRGTAVFKEEKQRLHEALVHDLRLLSGAFLANNLARDWLEVYLKHQEGAYIRNYDSRDLPILLPGHQEFTAQVVENLEGKGPTMVKEGNHIFVVAPPPTVGDISGFNLDRIFSGDVIPVPASKPTAKQKAVVTELSRRLITLAPLEGRPGKLLKVVNDYVYEIKNDLLYSDLVNIDSEKPFEYLDEHKTEQLVQQLGGKLSGLPFRMRTLVFSKLEELAGELKETSNEGDQQAAAQRVKLLVNMRIPETLQDVDGLYLEPLEDAGAEVGDLRKRIDLFKEQLSYYHLILEKSFDWQAEGGALSDQIKGAYQKHFGQLYDAQKSLSKLQHQVRIWMWMKYLPGANNMADGRLQQLVQEVEKSRERPARDLLILVHSLLKQTPRIVHVGERKGMKRIIGEDGEQSTVFVTYIVYAVGRGEHGLNDLPVLLEIPVSSASNVLQVVDKELMEKILKTVEETGG